MFEYIGERIRENVLANLPWISRAGGFTAPVLNADSGYYPGAALYPGAPALGVGDFVNMAPDESETALAFVDTEDEVFAVRAASKYTDFRTGFRVVVWYNSRKIAINAGSLNMALQSGITAGILATDFDTFGLSRTRVFFEKAVFAPAQIWGRYKMPEKDGLFVFPYYTFALKYRMIGRLIPACFTGEITITEGC